MKTKFIAFITSLLLFAGICSSCQNTLPYPDDQVQTEQVQLVKAPEVSVYSGGTLLSTSTRAAGYSNHYFNKERHQWPSEYSGNAPESVTDDEWTFVKDYLEQHPDGGNLTCDLADYFIQVVGKSYDNYDAGKDTNGASHNVTGSNHMDYIVIDGEHLNDYNGNAGSIALCLNWPLNNPAYHDSYGNVDNTKYNSYRFYYIEYKGKMNLYLCFDYTTQKDSGEYVEGDKVFSDWVLKIVPADGSAITQPNNPNIDLPEAHSEVEVNLAINDQHKYADLSDLVTKLSIHIRYPGDVKIIIPDLGKVVLESDDLYIFNKHDNILIHTGQLAKVQVGNYDEVVWSWTVEEDGGFTIKTEGMNQSIFDYCVENFGDGLNFEAYLYCNDTLEEPSALKEILDGATIEFVSGYPEYFINAHTDTYVLGEEIKRDCFVTINDTQASLYSGPKVGNHLNGTPFNYIYKYKGDPADESYEHGHTFLWGKFE